MRCPKFRNYDVSPGTKHKRGVKSRVKKLSVTRDQNSIFFLEVDPIPFLGLDLIDPWSSLTICMFDDNMLNDTKNLIKLLLFPWIFIEINIKFIKPLLIFQII